MFKKLQILVVLLISSYVLNGQNLSQDYIDFWVATNFSVSEVDTNAVYLLNGEYLDCIDCDNVWKEYLQNELIQVYFIDASEQNAIHNAKDLILVWTLGNQSKETIKEKWKKVKKTYKKAKKIYSESEIAFKEPVLIINEKRIKYPDSSEAIKGIRKSEIVGIGVYERAVSTDIYGANGVNGLVIIKTK